MKMVALLRGINVGGNRRIPMADLRKLAEDQVGSEVRSYIQSGNLAFQAKGAPAAVEAELERVIEARFGFFVEVLVRTEKRWSAYLERNPYLGAATDRPKQLHLCLSKKPLAKNATAALAERAKLGELVTADTDALFIDFPGGVGQSKLTPSVLDRAAGSCVTVRNWSTVLALAELMSALTSAR